MATSLLPVIGKPAPDFALPSTTGENISLRQFKGKKTVILYFYPKDETPGCTREACDLRDHSAELEASGSVVLGVSTDTLESHQHFRDKHKLPFPLLADVDATVAKLYGVDPKEMIRARTLDEQRAFFDSSLAPLFEKRFAARSMRRVSISVMADRAGRRRS